MTLVRKLIQNIEWIIEESEIEFPVSDIYHCYTKRFYMIAVKFFIRYR